MPNDNPKSVLLSIDYHIYTSYPCAVICADKINYSQKYGGLRWITIFL